MQQLELSEKEFRQYKELIYRIAGITMADSKRPLVSGRLAKRVRQHGLDSYGAYFERLSGNKDELQMVVDLLTTNETYFFREPKHFDFLRERLLHGARQGRPQASSSGEEAYSIAMVLDDCLGNTPWEVVASDISTRVLEKARTGLYPLARASQMPRPYLKRYCLKGTGEYDGKMLIEQSLRKRVQFRQVNLNQNLPDVGQFDVIFLRNVMIYFSQDTKRQVVKRLHGRLRKDGFMMVGHSESLNGISTLLEPVRPAIYRPV